MHSFKSYSSIPIKNVYYMLCYAWNHLEEKDAIQVMRGDEKDMKHLLTRILLARLPSLIKRGLYQEYREQTDTLATLRGKLQFQPSLHQMTFRQAKMVCDYDELDQNIVHNQIIKATLQALLTCSAIEKSIKNEILPIFKLFAQIDTIVLSHQVFQQLQFYRHNRHYRFILKICQYLMESLLLHEEGQDSQFADFEREPRAMARLFEDFVRQFYKQELRGFKVYRENITWQATGENLYYLPIMQTDISLENESRKIIVDTKYYQHTLSTYYDAEKVKSVNLYQLYAYLANLIVPENKIVEGILLYPQTTTEELSLSYNINHYSLKVMTVDLNQEWSAIHQRLLTIVGTT
ncbi:5-methylcytosine restriction system specificity protein McrC [Lysinibacillus piscis]|uniref:5-methylcytosine-specific restriction system specificity protein McrC n=1 Tax=Lysinibacillus piscis TaxID=2518931 RepID=A0ABQ5NN88_9BACI|nr:restriction endonuclease [Lysinibacillus sp. KH24]GLC89783.1 5-methylcytosine-specific restriction system specificity protein McrC [Lysinibacillus sp. KH24]